MILFDLTTKDDSFGFMVRLLSKRLYEIFIGQKELFIRVKIFIYQVQFKKFYVSWQIV